MGLTIHWNMKYTGRRDVVTQMERIRQRAMDLPFDEVLPLVHLKGDACDYTKEKDEGRRWMLIQAEESVDDPEIKGRSYRVHPLELISFTVIVAPGSEPANITLVKLPTEFMTRDGRFIKIRSRGWRGGSFCKTQYASNLGIPNFLRAHISVITLLEYISTLPAWKVEIRDEGDYGSHWSCPDWREADAEGRERQYALYPGYHDIPRLVKEVGEWNSMIAAFGGALKDALAKVSGEVVAPIFQRPDFEHLEMEGLKDLPPEHLITFLRACKEVPLLAEEE